MLTLNPKQLRALSIVAPGTLCQSGHTIGGEPFFITTDDDAARSGIWGIVAYGNGNIGLYTKQRSTGEQPTITAYADLIERQRAADEEERRFRARCDRADRQALSAR